MRDLPDWEPGTVCVLSTGAGPPHAIPVSTAVRAGPRRVLLALAARRETLARLRREPRCALTVMAADVACTVHARARIVEESLPGAEGVAAVSLDVDDIQDHMQPRFAIAAGVAWNWTDDDARASDAAVRGALAKLARR
jgi:flavin reductase (DIM6/NTAB) family NADH-FMN oxidoreductase RutF